MSFVQIVEFSTSQFDEAQNVGAEWWKVTEGKRKARRGVLCQDRDNPGRYFNIVFFDSYEAAMDNSALPETAALSGKLMALTDGPPNFYNLDVVEDRQ